jgi:hypothetical protein
VVRFDVSQAAVQVDEFARPGPLVKMFQASCERESMRGEVWTYTKLSKEFAAIHKSV